MGNVLLREVERDPHPMDRLTVPEVHQLTGDPSEGRNLVHNLSSGVHDCGWDLLQAFTEKREPRLILVLEIGRARGPNGGRLTEGGSSVPLSEDPVGEVRRDRTRRRVVRVGGPIMGPR